MKACSVLLLALIVAVHSQCSSYRPTSVYRQTPGMDQYCTMMCGQTAYCPASHCECADGGDDSETEEEWTVLESCPYPGIDDSWCEANCGHAGSAHCIAACCSNGVAPVSTYNVLESCPYPGVDATWCQNNCGHAGSAHCLEDCCQEIVATPSIAPSIEPSIDPSIDPSIVPPSASETSAPSASPSNAPLPDYISDTISCSSGASSITTDGGLDLLYPLSGADTILRVIIDQPTLINITIADSAGGLMLPALGFLFNSTLVLDGSDFTGEAMPPVATYLNDLTAVDTWEYSLDDGIYQFGLNSIFSATYDFTTSCETPTFEL